MNSKRLFGTDGVRGIVNSDLTPEMVLRLALAIGTLFGPGSRILVGSDLRAGSGFIVKLVTGGLVSTGVKVYEAGLVPTPALQYYVKTQGFDGGVMVTASHNPPEYSGVKVVMADGVEAAREVEEEIEGIYYEGGFRRVPWHQLSQDTTKVHDVIDKYIGGVASLVDTERVRRSSMKVVVDPANNVGTLSTPRLLRILGVKAVTINSDLSPIPSRNPEPSPENLSYLVEVVRSSAASFGIAHDGDADRSIYISGDGKYVPGDISAILLCSHIINNRGEKNPPRVVTAVSSTTLVGKVLADYGVEVVWTRVGSIVISRTMMRIGAIAGFEENGGFIYPKHQYVRDGAMSLALMLELLSCENTSLSDLLNRLPSRYIVKRKVYVDKAMLPRVYERIKERFRGIEFVEIDGIKAISEKFWFLVRPSGTEPLVRVFIEAETEDMVNEVLKELVDIFTEVLGSEVRIA